MTHRLRVSYHPGYYAPIPETHAFPMRKFEGLRAHLTGTGVVREEDVIPPKMISAQDLQLVHTPRYIDGVINGGLDPKEIRRLGLPWTHQLGVRSRLAVQGTVNAALMALHDGVAGNLAGGTHHAFPDHGEGFCVFNDVAVAIRMLRQACWVRRVLVVDCDVHQGNGTASIFAGEPEVFTFSIHGQNNFPFRKQTSDLDVGLDDGAGDVAYLDTLDRALSTCYERISPDLVFYLAGIDVLASDRFGRISLTVEGLRLRDRLVIRSALSRNVPVVLLLSGGYAPALDQTVRAHAVMFESAVDILNGGGV